MGWRDSDEDIAIWAGICNAVLIFLFDTIYWYLKEYLNHRENHRTQRQFENSNILKSFIFRFTNTFLSLFWIAFVQPEMSDTKKTNGEIMNALRIQLACLFATAIVLQNLTEYLYWPVYLYIIQ